MTKPFEHPNPRSAAVLPMFDRDAERLADRYESVSFSTLYASITDLLPPVGRVLDVGCGSGRDAAHFAGDGYAVVAIDGSAGMLSQAESRHPHADVSWRRDTLPELRTVDGRFDIVWCNAVFMFLDGDTRARSLPRLARLLGPAGILVIGVKHGAMDEKRMMEDVSPSEILALAAEAGLRLVRHAEEADGMGRLEVRWSLIVLERVRR